MYNAENLFIIPYNDGKIKNLVYLMLEDNNIVVRTFVGLNYIDFFLGQSLKSKDIATDLKRRIKINTFLESNNFKGYIKKKYNANDIHLFYNAFIVNFNNLSTTYKRLFDKLANNAASKWCQIINFTESYDSFNNNRHLTTITDPNIVLPNNPLNEKLKKQFQMCLTDYFKMFLYAQGKNYEQLREESRNLYILRRCAEQVNIKGYVRNDIVMSFSYGQVFFEIYPANVIRMADYRKK